MAEERCVLASVGVVISSIILDESQLDDDTTEEMDMIVLAAACASLIRDDRVKVCGYVNVVDHYLPDQFKSFFRLSRETFQFVLRCLIDCPELARSEKGAGRPEIPLEKDLLMTLWYIGSQENIKSIADRFDVQESTFVAHNRRLLDVFSDKLCRKFVVWPSDNDKHSIMRTFEQLKGFPGVLGAIDGTHIAITPPSQHESDYVNRKGFHSVILQAVCKYDRVFTDIYCGWPGRLHDARVFRNSDIGQNLVALCGQNHIIGDGAYPISRMLMKPYRDNRRLTNAEKTFNKCLCSTRTVIEHSFGMLKGRFRRLQHIRMNAFEYTVKCIVTACVLHNICIFEEDELEEYYENNVPNIVVPVYNPPTDEAEGNLKRILITRQLSNL